MSLPHKQNPEAKDAPENFRYNKPPESLSVNLPLGSTVEAIAYEDYSEIGRANVFVEIDAENPGECYKDYLRNL